MRFYCPMPHAVFLTGALLVGPCLPEASAQTVSAGKAIVIKLFGPSRSAFLVDFETGQAASIGIPLDERTAFQLSPDQQYLAVTSSANLTVYKVNGLSLQQAVKVADGPSIGTRWSRDGRYLVYIREMMNPDGSSTDQVYIWERETGQTKRLL